MAAATAGIGQVLALTDLDNVRSQAVAARLGMSDEGTTDRWFGLTARQFRKILAVGDDEASATPRPDPGRRLGN